MTARPTDQPAVEASVEVPAEATTEAGHQVGADSPADRRASGDAPAMPTGRRTRRPLVAGALAGMWALLVGLALVTCLVMLTWAVSPNSDGDSAAAWSAAGLTWLAAHLVPLTISGQPMSLWPVGGLLVGLLLTRRSGAWTGRLLPEPSGGEVLGLLLGAALIYGGGGAGVAWLADGPSASARPVEAFLWTAVVAMVGTAWGVSREARLVASARDRLSDAACRTLTAGLAAVMGLVAVGALLVTVSLVRSFPQVGQTLGDLGTGPFGALGATLIGALSLPNLDVWAMSVVVGPGFEVGGIGGLSAFGGQVGSLPALPVLAAIPSTMPGWAPVLLVVPVLMGALAGRIRWGRDLPTPSGAAAAAGSLGAVVAVLIGGLVALSSGSMGGGDLAHVGPALVPVVLAGTGLVVLGFLLEAAFQSVRLSWELHRAEQRTARERAERERIEAETYVVAEVAVDSDDELGDRVDLTDMDSAASRPAWRRVTDVPGVVGSFGAVVTERLVGVVSAGAHAVVDLRGGAPATEADGAETDRSAADGSAADGTEAGGGQLGDGQPRDGRPGDGQPESGGQKDAASPDGEDAEPVPPTAAADAPEPTRSTDPTSAATAQADSTDSSPQHSTAPTPETDR